jgi:hypothetical protein
MSDPRSLRRPAAVVPGVALLAAVGLAPLAVAPAADPPGPPVPAEVGAAPDPPLPDGGPLTTVERLRVTLLGGNPIFALDWLAPGLELQGGRPAPPRPRLPLP